MIAQKREELTIQCGRAKVTLKLLTLIDSQHQCLMHLEPNQQAASRHESENEKQRARQIVTESSTGIVREPPSDAIPSQKLWAESALKLIFWG